MAEESTELETRKDSTVASAEPTRPGAVVTPAVDIFEDKSSITVLADLPGVQPDDISIDLHENVLTITGPVRRPEGEGEEEVHREYATGTFYRQFRLSNTISQDSIEAELVDGVLRLEMPKVEAAKPRQIAVKTSS